MGKGIETDTEGSHPSFLFYMVPLCTKGGKLRLRAKMSMENWNRSRWSKGLPQLARKGADPKLWGQQRAALQSPRPTGECVLYLIKSRKGIWDLQGVHRWRDRIRHRTGGAPTIVIVQKRIESDHSFNKYLCTLTLCNALYSVLETKFHPQGLKPIATWMNNWKTFAI